MGKQYKVTVDQSMLASNSTTALEKKMNEMSQAGWNLSHVTTVATEGSSAIYMIWERA